MSIRRKKPFISIPLSHTKRPPSVIPDTPFLSFPTLVIGNPESFLAGKRGEAGQGAGLSGDFCNRGIGGAESHTSGRIDVRGG